tara:strand:- start:1308 stop:1457 length:150 start_codon:yes stop_codon:yes gene_type:complete
MIVKKIFAKIYTFIIFNVGVDVLGFPVSVKHIFNRDIKERNVLQRYSYK